MRQLLLRQTVQHVTLILRRIQALLQQILAIRPLFDARVMAGDDRFAAQLHRPFVQFAELQEAVALDAGIGRAPVLVIRSERADDALPELVLVIERVERHAEAVRHAAGVLGVVQAAAGLAFLQLRSLLSGKVPELHGAADAVVPFFFCQQSRDGGIHAAAHGDECFHEWISSLATAPPITSTTPAMAGTVIGSPSRSADNKTATMGSI